jgi:hypothetical protein
LNFHAFYSWGESCLFCAPQGNDQMILSGRNDTVDFCDCSRFPFHLGSGGTADYHNRFTVRMSRQSRRNVVGQ